MIYLPSISGTIDPDSSTGAGGAENQMLLLAQGLSALGLRVCMAAFDDGGELPDSVNGVDLVRRAPYQAGRGLRGAPREAGEIYAALAEADADAVLTRGAVPVIALVAWSARLQRRRFFYSSANLSDFEHAQVEPNPRNRGLVRHGIGLAQEIIVQTDEQRRLCQAAFRRTPRVIRSIAQPAELREQEPEAFLWVGRLVWYKQPLEFVNLARAVPEARFWMVGVPEPSEESHKLLEQVQAAAAGVSNLELLAPVPRSELATLITRSVAIVNTSEFEGMSNVFLEGWARGVPGIALSHDPDGLIERSGLGGFAGGSTDRLASIVRKRWEKRHDQDELAARCQRHVREHHAPTAVYAQWCDALGVTEGLETEQPQLIGA
jgi:glycosyltransferase involved in cell wall biosynthesis